MNRLKELRKEKKISQKKLSEIFEVTEKTISRWENEEVQIKSDKAEKLADYFGVQLPYLLGWSDMRTLEEELEYDFKQRKESYQKEKDTILKIGYLLSENQLENIIDTIRIYHRLNGRIISGLIENNDEFIEDELEVDFYSFIRKYPNYVEEKKEEYKLYKEKYKED